MKNLKEILAKIIEKNTLEHKIEWAYECEIDYRKALKAFENLLDEITEDLKGYPKAVHVESCLEDIAEDIRSGYTNLDEIEDIHFYTFEDYVETHITANMTAGERNIFDRFWYFIDGPSRKEWVEAEYWSNYEGLYTNRMKDFVIMVEK